MDVVFERFPASVRGAIVVRGADPDPHQIHLGEATVVDAARRVNIPVAVDRVVMDIPPRGEVVVPFDITFGDLEPGWYGVDAAVVVDGRHDLKRPQEVGRFLVPWPGGQTRKGTLEPRLAVGEATVRRVELRGDRATFRWTGPEGSDLRISADGSRLAELESTGDPSQRTTVVYPVLRSHRFLQLHLHRRGAPKATATLDLP